MSKGLASRFGAAGNMNEKVKCPRCGAKYDLLSKVAGEALGGLCAACWYEKKSHEGEREVGREEGQKRIKSHIDTRSASSH